MMPVMRISLFRPLIQEADATENPARINRAKTRKFTKVRTDDRECAVAKRYLTAWYEVVDLPPLSVTHVEQSSAVGKGFPSLFTHVDCSQAVSGVFAASVVCRPCCHSGQFCGATRARE